MLIPSLLGTGTIAAYGPPMTVLAILVVFALLAGLAKADAPRDLAIGAGLVGIIGVAVVAVFS